jgi:hypothetical protein
MMSIRAKAFRDQGDAYLRDADNASLSSRSRADLAFDAIYMYATSLLDGTSFTPDQLDAEVLFHAAATLGMAPQSMMPAVVHLNDRRRNLRSKEQLPDLMALAHRLQDLTRPLRARPMSADN